MKVRNILFDKDYYHRPNYDRFFAKHPNVTQRDAVNRFLKNIAEGTFAYERVDCLCGHDEFDIMTSVERHKIPQFMGICTRCGLVMNNPRLDARSYNLYYTSGIYRAHVGAVVQAAHPTDRVDGAYERISAFLRDHDPHYAQRKRVFEIGCHTGYNLFGFKSHGWEVGGVEPFQPSCDEANKFGLNAVCDVVENLKGNNDNDLVYFMEVFEHVLDPGPALAAIRTLLKPDGLLYIGHIGLLHEGWDDVYKFAQVGHPYNHSLATLRMIVEAHGFEFVAGDETINAIFRPAPLPVDGPRYIPNPRAYAAIVDKFAAIDCDYTPLKGFLQGWKARLIDFLIEKRLLAPALRAVRCLRAVTGTRR